MRLKRRKHQRELTSEEKEGLRDAEAGLKEAKRALRDVKARGAEVESIVSWFNRARDENHFSLRIRYMLEHHEEEPRA
jgi:hypothetical protein